MDERGGFRDDGFAFRKEFVEDYVYPYGREIQQGKIVFEEHYESPTWHATGRPEDEDARNDATYYKPVKARLHDADIRIADMDRRGVKWRIFKDINMVDIHYKPSDYSSWEPVPSGLNSPVFLVRQVSVSD